MYQSDQKPKQVQCVFYYQSYSFTDWEQCFFSGSFFCLKRKLSSFLIWLKGVFPFPVCAGKEYCHIPWCGREECCPFSWYSIEEFCPFHWCGWEESSPDCRFSWYCCKEFALFLGVVVKHDFMVRDVVENSVVVFFGMVDENVVWFLILEECYVRLYGRESESCSITRTFSFSLKQLSPLPWYGRKRILCWSFV